MIRKEERRGNISENIKKGKMYGMNTEDGRKEDRQKEERWTE